jgi:hypothetical protein
MVQEVEDTLVSFLERGATIETDILSNIKLLLPPDVTKQLDDLIPPPPNAQPAVDEAAVFDEPPVMYTADSVLENQIGEHQAKQLHWMTWLQLKDTMHYSALGIVTSVVGLSDVMLGCEPGPTHHPTLSQAACGQMALSSCQQQ